MESEKPLLGNLGGMGTVLLENAGRRKLAELVTHHVFRNKHGNKGSTVVHVERMPDEIGSNGRSARPSLDRLLLVGLVEFIDLLKEFPLHEGAFFEGA